MNGTLKMALVVAAAVVAGVACGPAAVAPSSAVAPSAVAPSSVAVAPSAAPSPSLQASTTAPTPSLNLLDTSTWTTYVSKRNGFSIAHPADWNVDPSDHDWTIAKDAANPVNTGAEHFSTGGAADGQGVGVSVWSVAVDPGTSVDSWRQVYCPPKAVACIPGQAVAVSLDGHPGSLMTLDDVPQAFFLVDGRIYAIACWLSDDDPIVSMYGGSQRLVESFISTMHLLPGGPAPSTTPGPS